MANSPRPEAPRYGTVARGHGATGAATIGRGDSTMRRTIRLRTALQEGSSFITAADWTRISASLRLSTRESEIARLALTDVSETTIADRLAISKHTVHSHIERLYRKLAIRSRSQLVVKLFEAYVCLNQSLTVADGSSKPTGA